MIDQLIDWAFFFFFLNGETNQIILALLSQHDEVIFHLWSGIKMTNYSSSQLLNTPLRGVSRLERFMLARHANTTCPRKTFFCFKEFWIVHFVRTADASEIIQ